MGKNQSKNNNAMGKRRRHARPPSPPRGLRDLIENDQLNEEFKAYLANLDQDNDDTTLTTWLSFVSRMRDFRDCDPNDSKGQKAVVTSIAEDFFNSKDRKRRVALKNSVLREECIKSLNPANDEDKYLPNLWQAEEAVSKQLESHHQMFLQQRKKNSNNSLKALQDQVQACLL